MIKGTIGLALVCFLTTGAAAQGNDKQPVDTTHQNVDSVAVEAAKEASIDNIAVVSLDDNDLGSAGSQNISSVLTAGRDPFFSAASFNFNAVRFKIRGYEGDQFGAYLNGIPIENLDNGFTPFGLWGGLNDVMRNKTLSIGLQYNNFAFGNLGSTTSIDSRASKQRKQTQVNYTFSNRNYTHKVSLTHSTGMTKNGWAFTFSGSRRYADEGYGPGTYYNGWSYFGAVDKKLGQKHLLSFAAFGAPTENGKQGAAVAEVRELTGDNFYNPYWGYQDGKKRNANVNWSNQPVFILTHDFKINSKTSLITAAGYSFGKRSSSSLDWYKAQDPRPDYYRYLPSYYDDPALKEQIANAFRNDPSVSQINWARLYDANRSGNITTVDGSTGRISKYLLSEYVTKSHRFNVNTVFNSKLNSHTNLTGGASYQWQENNYYKRINDLLGGDLFVDLNQFAEFDYPNDPNAIQNDLNRPNRAVVAGQRYGYDYEISINKTSGWLQSAWKYKKADFFLAAELSYTSFYRTGNVKNGLFPTNSYGKSDVNDFFNYAVKGGVTYKVDGKNYLYLNATYQTKAPFFDNIYISARTRDTKQDNVTSEKIMSAEGGYVYNGPELKLRVTGYYTQINDGMNVISYYDDRYNNFVNYALNNIDKLHFGGELGFEARVIPHVAITGAVSAGRYYYNSRMNGTRTLDNDAHVLDKGLIYSENFRVGGTPQEVYNLGITYRSPKYWSVSLNGNYFDQMWLDINPIRRTERAVEDVDYKSELWNGIIDQQQLKGKFTLDFYGSWSYKVPKSWGLKRRTFIVLNGGISNLLNSKDIISGGFEQLRYDFDTHNVDKFPPKYFYAYGMNFFASVTVRF